MLFADDKGAALSFEFDIQGGDFNAAGDASSRIKRILQQVGVRQEIVRRVAVSCYEAEMNVVIHAYKGRIRLEADLNKVKITVEDQGPGIADVELAMTPGYSTAPDYVREMGFGAGMGLPNMKNCSSDMVIETKKGEGTSVRMVFEND